MSILKGDIVWINGPLLACLYADINIFCEKLKGALDKDEHVVADDEYIGEPPGYVKRPAKTFQSNPEMFQYVRA